MTGALRKVRAEMVRPLLHRPPELQVAALCCRADASGGTEVLLITSRDTGRWVLPKGWPMPGRSDAEAARIEAWEEAGVKAGRLSDEPVGSYGYSKRLDGGETIPVRVRVWRLDVVKMARTYPEQAERRRVWLSPKAAAQRVDEPELKTILRRL